MQKEVLTRQGGYSSVFEDALSEIFIVRQGSCSSVVLRKGGAATAAEAMAGCLRGYPEQQSGITVQRRETQAEIGAGEFGMDGVIGIEDRLGLPKILKGGHECNGGVRERTLQWNAQVNSI
ncbi:MAG: hypothetical protein WBF99_19255 [Xanthobacteraceae bacterium]